MFNLSVISVASAALYGIGEDAGDTRNTNPRSEGHVGVKRNVEFWKAHSDVTLRQNVDFSP